MFGLFSNFKKLNNETILDFVSKENKQLATKKMMVDKTKYVKSWEFIKKDKLFY